MHYVTRRSHRMQKHNFGITCPIALFMESALGPPKHEKYFVEVSCLKCTGARNASNTLFLMLRWYRYKFHKKARWDTLRQTCVFASIRIYGSHSAFQFVRGMKRQGTIFHAQEGPIRIPQKHCRNTLRQTCVFASIGICGSRSAFRCVRGVKRRRTIFHGWVGPIRV
jgi:hypothetical protein